MQGQVQVRKQVKQAHVHVHAQVKVNVKHTSTITRASIHIRVSKIRGARQIVIYTQTCLSICKGTRKL